MITDNPGIVKSEVLSVGVSPAEPVEQGLSSKAIDPNEKHLCTDHLLMDLKGRMISSGFVTIAAQGVKFALNLASIVVLARLLTPQDFGLVAMVTAATSLLVVLRDAGLSTATVQKEGITHAEVSNLFWVNLVLGAVISVLVSGLAPVIAWFYREPRLVGITLALSMTFLLRGSTIQHIALLKRQMRFKAIAVIEVSSMAAGFATGIVMALLGCGYWSLVGSALSMEGAGLLLTWCVSSWRPQLPRRHSGTRALLKFGASMTAGGSLYLFSRSIDSLLLGRRYGPDSVGLYSRAMALLMRPLEQLLTPISSVFIPALARLQGEPARYRRAFLQFYEAMALVGFALAGLLLPLAHPLTLVLLGPKWEKAAVIFSAFAIAALYMPPSAAAAWLLISQGRGKDYVLMNLISSVLIIAAFIAGLPFGPVGVALAFSVSGLLIRSPVLYYLIGRRGPVSAKDLWVGFFRHLPLWVTVFSATYLTHIFVLHSKPIMELLICVPIGLTAGLVTIFILPHQRSLALQGMNTVKEMLSRRQA